MEINKFMETYKKYSPEEFFNWLSSGRIIEVRFLNDKYGNKFNDWDLIRHLSEELSVEYRFSSLYISTYNQLKTILLYKLEGFPLTRLYNIFISVNTRRKVYTRLNNGLLKKTYYGGIAGTSHIETILCDIEHEGKREGNATEEMLEECIQGANYLVKLLDLHDYYINISGNGVHLWFKLDKAIPIPIPKLLESKKTKYDLKEEGIFTLIKTYNRFIEKLEKDLKAYNPRLKVDEGAKDIARIARPPGSWNIKVGKTARAVGTVDFKCLNNKYNYKNFMAVQPIKSNIQKNYKKIKILSNNHRYNHLNLSESPLVRLLLSQMLPSNLSRNHYLEQSLAKLIRDNDIDLFQIEKLIQDIDTVQQKTIQVDPDYLDDEEPFNSETINSYCYGCRIDLVYDLLEDVPEIKEGFITKKHYNNLNNYSEKSLETIKIDNVKKPETLFELKTLIRNLIDEHPRSSVFATIKLLFSDEWDYFHRNEIALKLLNKTRRRE